MALSSSTSSCGLKPAMPVEVTPMVTCGTPAISAASGPANSEFSLTTRSGPISSKAVRVLTSAARVRIPPKYLPITSVSGSSYSGSRDQKASITSGVGSGVLMVGKPNAPTSAAPDNATSTWTSSPRARAARIIGTTGWT
jgi:hypothetical protein